MERELQAELILEVLELLQMNISGHTGPHCWRWLCPRLEILSLVEIVITLYKLLLKERVELAKVDIPVREDASLQRELLHNKVWVSWAITRLGILEKDRLHLLNDLLDSNLLENSLGLASILGFFDIL